MTEEANNSHVHCTCTYVRICKSVENQLRFKVHIIHIVTEQRCASKCTSLLERAPEGAGSLPRSYYLLSTL